jgi:hypothetical protein
MSREFLLGNFICNCRCAGRDVMELCCNCEAGLSCNQYFKTRVIISQNPISIYVTQKYLLMVFRKVFDDFY